MKAGGADALEVTLVDRGGAMRRLSAIVPLAAVVVRDKVAARAVAARANRMAGIVDDLSLMICSYVVGCGV